MPKVPFIRHTHACIGPVASCLWVDEALESQLYLDGIVTVVDAKHITRHIDTRRQETGTSGDLILTTGPPLGHPPTPTNARKNT